MERGKSNLNLPDAINCSISENFTQIPNDLIRNPELSGNAKTILSILLSNRNGWHSYVDHIKTMMKEKEFAIRSAIKELENTNYLRRIRYRNKTTKAWKGMFWAYTNIPGEFDLKNNLITLESHNLEAIEPYSGKPDMGKPDMGKPDMGNQGIIILNNNNTNNKNIKLPEKNLIPPPIELIRQYCKDRKNEIDPEKFHDFYTCKGWLVGKNKMKDWQAAVRTWEKDNPSKQYKSTPTFYPGQKRADGAQWKKCPDDKFHWVKFDDNGARYIEDSEGVFRRAGGTPWID